MKGELSSPVASPLHKGLTYLLGGVHERCAQPAGDVAVVLPPRVAGRGVLLEQVAHLLPQRLLHPHRRRLLRPARAPAGPARCKRNAAVRDPRESVT
eukprot:7896940-Pyramimonas_sp.AAC.1